jgi:hypothetical protein
MPIRSGRVLFLFLFSAGALLLGRKSGLSRGDWLKDYFVEFLIWFIEKNVSTSAQDAKIHFPLFTLFLHCRYFTRRWIEAKIKENWHEKKHTVYVLTIPANPRDQSRIWLAQIGWSLEGVGETGFYPCTLNRNRFSLYIWFGFHLTSWFGFHLTSDLSSDLFFNHSPWWCILCILYPEVTSPLALNFTPLWTLTHSTL